MLNDKPFLLELS